tara:strand:+ start:433 stop:1506 length:1074 start_codon:yes stop_codon:yes gene_type:complete
MEVQLFDLSRLLLEHKSSLLNSLSSSIDSASFILGDDVSYFEKEFAEDVDSSYCIGASSGTDALLAILMALDIESGSDIIVPSFTFVSSASTIVRAGFNPVFVDIERESFVTSLSLIEKAWTKNTKAVMFVHLFGEHTDLTELNSFCKEKGAFLIEDCAQAYGAPVGNYGDAGAFSFFPAKNLGCLGDGGAITTNDASLNDKLRMVISHGSKKKYHYELLGGNFRIDTIQASFLRVLLGGAKSWISKRGDNASFYTNELSGVGDLILPAQSDGHSWNQYTLITKKRDMLREHLSSFKIGSAIYYPNPLHKSHVFGCDISLPETEKRCLEALSIPIYPGLSDDERCFVVEKIRSFFNG